MNICLQKYSSDCFYLPYKGLGKADNELVNVQSVLCEDALRLKRMMVV